MAKFKVGDKVRVIKASSLFGMSRLIGKVGIISRDDGSGIRQYRLDIDDPTYPWSESELELVEPRREFIVIHRNGNVMTAEHRVNRDVIKSAKATCAPSDTFDFDTGAKLAFDRLMGREEPKPAPKKLFKVGDRVVTFMGHGRVVQVDANSDTMPYWISYDDGCTLWINSGTAKLEQPAPKPAHRFKVGDRVVTSIGHGKIIQVDPEAKGGKPYWIEYDNGYCYWMNSAEAKPEPNSSPAPEPPKFYTGKVFAVNPKPQSVDDPAITIRNNRVYEFKDGYIVGDRCGLVQLNQPYKSFKEFAEDKYSTEWREVKEPSDV